MAASTGDAAFGVATSGVAAAGTTAGAGTVLAAGFFPGPDGCRRVSAGMLAVSAGLSAGFSAADFSKAAFSEAAFSEAAFSEAAFSETPFALPAASGRLARSEEVSGGFESALKSTLGVTFFGFAEDTAAAAGASAAGLAVI